jgi:hypothetical protein
MDIQNISVWSIPILLTFGNELMWRYEKTESDDLVIALNMVEEEVKKRKWNNSKLIN